MPPALIGELEAELAWFTRVLDLRFRHYFAATNAGTLADAEADPLAEPPPDLAASATPYAAFVRAHARELPARLALVLALVPHLRPQLLDVFFTKNATFDRRFTEFGGRRRNDDFEPTGETLAFVLGAGSVEARVAAAQVLDADAGLLRSGALSAPDTTAGATSGAAPTGVLKTPLVLGAEHLALFTTGTRPRPALGADFPAERIETTLDWDDLVLHPATLERVLEVQTFIAHGHTLLHDWGLAARMRPGLRALFHGQPGTGKTLCVALLGRHTGCEVYRVDLSLVVSKYIGETEKNLARVFDRAQQRDWILFFDEADALFGKRSETRDAHDRYANQEVAYLLQRIESFDGITILASNRAGNLDEAFMRRFELVVYFPMPQAAERLRLWRGALPAAARLAEDVELPEIAREYELSGGAIVNVVRRVCLAAIAQGGREIGKRYLVEAIKAELAKEGRHV